MAIVWSCHYPLAIIFPIMDSSPPSDPIRRRFSNENDDRTPIKRHESINSIANSSISTRSHHSLPSRRSFRRPPAAPLVRDRWSADSSHKRKPVKKKRPDPLAGYDVQVIRFSGQVMRPQGGIPVTTLHRDDASRSKLYSV